MYNSANDMLTVRSGHEYLKKNDSKYVPLGDLAALLHPRVRISRKSEMSISRKSGFEKMK